MSPKRQKLAPSTPIPLSHPAAIIAIAVAALCVLVSVSFVLIDTDFWQHLLVGKAIWRLHAFPTRQLWTWPTYGVPDLAPSWGFCALIWPLWKAAGVWGLSLWRWLTTLTAFGLMWATARRMGAKGLSPLIVLVICSLSYRQRAQIRPETLVAVFIAAEVWILERRRAISGKADDLDARGSRHDLALGVIPIAWAWANTHISYILCFVLLAIYGIDAAIASRKPARRASRRAERAPSRAVSSAHPNLARTHLALVGLAAFAVCFINPYGWRSLIQPFQFAWVWRNEPIFKLIEELQPIQWSLNIKNGLPLLMLGWPVLLVWRAVRHGLDRVEAMICAIMTPLAFQNSRFIGFYALLAAPFLARDLDQWLRGRPGPSRSVGTWARAALTIGVCAVIGIPEWSRSDPRLGIGIDLKRFPVAACDFMAEHGVRGHGFNKFELGGYQLYRFWPDTSRLPFIDIHQTGTTEDRLLYASALTTEGSWRALDRRYHFDYALLDRPQSLDDRIADFMDADSTWALVVWDDPSRLYVRRSGRLAAIARAFGCEVLAGGLERLQAQSAATLSPEADSLLKARLARDLGRQASRSRFNASAKSLLADLEMIAGHDEAARKLLNQAIHLDPWLPRAHERLGVLALDEDRPAQALREFEREKSMRNPEVAIDFRLGQAYQELGDFERARDAYRRETRLHPAYPAAWDSLRVMEERGR